MNGLPQGKKAGENDLRPVGHLSKLADGKTETGPLGPIEYLATLQQSEVVLWSKKELTEGKTKTVTWSPVPTPGTKIMRPGNSPTYKGLQSEKLMPRLNFISLMLAP